MVTGSNADESLMIETMYVVMLLDGMGCRNLIVLLSKCFLIYLHIQYDAYIHCNYPANTKHLYNIYTADAV